jgi:hypothetical protein|tara:strand:+ start:12389 stop:13159 length:771 start_codon:yes stop_codon:yes gene_type:complete
MAEDTKPGLVETMLSSDESGTKDVTPINLKMFSQDLIKSNLGINQSKSKPWSEQDFHPSDLEAFKSVLTLDIDQKGKYKEGETRHLHYDDYASGKKDAYYAKGTKDKKATGEEGYNTLVRLIKDPELRAKLSTGQFTSTYTKEKGYVLGDVFDFGDTHGEKVDGKVVDSRVSLQNDVKRHEDNEGNITYLEGKRYPFLKRYKQFKEATPNGFEPSYGYLRTLGRYFGSTGAKGNEGRRIEINLGGDLTPIDLNKND